MNAQEQILDFLKRLAQNNNRQWFNAHKDEYNHLKLLYEEMVTRFISAISEFDEEIKSVQTQDCLFRIYRDIRFSPDKTPYKTHFGAYIAAQGGRKSTRAGYYFHLEPENNMLTGGIWMPDPATLKILRQSIYENMDEFLDILHAPDFVKYYSDLDGRKLSIAPRPYSKDYEHVDLLKYKDYTAFHHITPKMLKGEDLVLAAIPVFKAIYPLNRFLNYALDEAREHSLNKITL